MDRSTFLQTYKDGLNIFEESYQQKKVLELDDKISSLLSSFKNEEEAISSLGDVSLLVQDVYKENHLALASKKQKNGFFSTHISSLSEVIGRVIDVMSKNSVKANLKILFDILILIILVCVIKIPFILVRDWVNSLLSFLSIPILLTLWNFVVEVLYVVVAVLVFLNIFKRWFQNLKVEQK